MIPLLDLEAQHASLGDSLDAAIATVMAHRRFINGPELAQFEQNFAAYCRAEQCVGVSSGTTALELALEAAGVGPGDEVVTTAYTFIATVESIVHVGAKPVLIDPELETALTTVEAVEAACTDKTAAVIVVHLYGQTVDLAGFRELADRRKLLLIEDAAQSHGAVFNGLRAGSIGDLSTFSFFPGKNLGAIGDAGGVTTNDASLAEKVRLLRDHGRTSKYEHGVLGTNARLDTLQAAVLDVKLPHLDGWNRARAEHAAAYDEAFADLEGVDPIELVDGATGVYHQYVVRVAEREQLMETLAKHEIATAIHYPKPLTEQPALAGLTRHGETPNAERLAREVLSLPVFPELSPEQRSEVIGAVREHASLRHAVG